jgi:hypothetical protein
VSSPAAPTIFGEFAGATLICGQIGHRITIVPGKQVGLVFARTGRASRVFEPFFTSHRDKGECGLGMHIVYNLVSQVLGGTINWMDQPDASARRATKLTGIAPDRPGARIQ